MTFMYGADTDSTLNITNGNVEMITVMANRADRRRANVADSDAFRSAFVQAEIVMRQALSRKIQVEIDTTENTAVVLGLQIAQKIVMGEIRD